MKSVSVMGEDVKTMPGSNVSRRRFRWERVIAIALLCAAAAGATGIFRQRSGNAPESEESLAQAVASKPVLVGVRRLSDIEAPRQWIPFRGTVDPRRESTLAFRRSGRIQTVAVEVGDFIDEGEILARLDTSDLDVNAAIADAELAVATALDAEAKAGPRAQTIAAAKARVRQLSATLQAAELRERRLAKLHEQGATSLEAYQNEQQLVAQLEASVKEAEQVLEELEAGTRREQVASAKARMEAAKASRAMIDVQREDSLIRAPYRCYVSERLVDEGAIVGPNQPIVTVIEEPPLEASFGLPSDFADEIQVGQVVMVTVDTSASPVDFSGASEPYDRTHLKTAHVVRLQPRVDDTTRLREVVVEFPAESTVQVGRPITLWLDDASVSRPSGGQLDRNSYWVPSDCVVRGVRGLWGVFAAETSESDGSRTVVKLRDVKIIGVVGEMTHIETTLPPDAFIVTSGSHRVGPGVEIETRIESALRGAQRTDAAADPSVEATP